MGLLFPSEEFGQTPPPTDGGIIACPTCVNGRRYIGPHSFPCPDCLGSDVQGYGFTALRVFEEWIEDLPSDEDG